MYEKKKNNKLFNLKKKCISLEKKGKRKINIFSAIPLMDEVMDWTHSSARDCGRDPVLPSSLSGTVAALSEDWPAKRLGDTGSRPPGEECIIIIIIIIIMVLFYLFIQYYAVLKEISIR